MPSVVFNSGTALPESPTDREVFLIENSPDQEALKDGVYYYKDSTWQRFRGLDLRRFMASQREPSPIQVKQGDLERSATRMVLDATVDLIEGATPNEVILAARQLSTAVSTTFEIQINCRTAQPLLWTSVEDNGQALNWTAQENSWGYTYDSKVYAARTGLYEFSYKTSSNIWRGGTRNLKLSLRKNGTDFIDKSASYSYLRWAHAEFASNDAVVKVRLEEGDYIELMAERVGRGGSIYLIPEESFFTAKYLGA